MIAALWQRLLRDPAPHWQFLRYGLVGGVNTAITLALFILLKGMGLHYTLYSLIGYGAGFISSYVLNRRFTFTAAAQHVLLPFLVANGGLFLAVQLLQSLTIEQTRWPDLPVVMGFMVLYTGCGFFINRRLFATKKP